MADSITPDMKIPLPVQKKLTPIQEAQDQLPMKLDIQTQFIEAARALFHHHAEVDDLKLYNYLLEFARRFPRMDELEDTRTLEEAIKIFIWEITKPLRIAEEQVLELENRIHEKLKNHQVLALDSSDFTHDYETTVKTLRDYVDLSRGFAADIESVRRHVSVVQKLFNDTDDRILLMRDRLHDYETILQGQAGRAEYLLRYCKDVHSQARLLGSLKAEFNSMLDLMTYLKRTYPQQQVRILFTDKPIPLAKPFIMRNIARHWIRNSLDKGASAVEVELKSYDHGMLIFSVTDDVPGGFPQGIRPRLGKEQILHYPEYDGGSGYEIICKLLAPQLGDGTRIVIETPLNSRAGSRTSIIFPRELPEQKSTPPGNGLEDHRSRPVPITFVEMDAPDWVQRSMDQASIAEYYRNVNSRDTLFGLIRSGGMKVHGAPQNMSFTVTFNLSPGVLK